MSEDPRGPENENHAEWSLQHHPDRPYLNGEPLRTGDRVGVEIGDEIIVGTAHVEGDDREQRITLIPDGDPWKYSRDYALAKYGRDYAFAEVLAGEDLQFTAHRWLKGDPIPYDEMRRLCGLPDVSAYVARRELARMGRELREGFRRFGEAWAEAAEQALPGLRAISEAAKPKQAPPIWAQNPAGQHRPTKTRNHRRVK